MQLSGSDLLFRTSCISVTLCNCVCGCRERSFGSRKHCIFPLGAYSDLGDAEKRVCPVLVAMRKAIRISPSFRRARTSVSRVSAGEPLQIAAVELHGKRSKAPDKLSVASFAGQLAGRQTIPPTKFERVTVRGKMAPESPASYPLFRLAVAECLFPLQGTVEFHRGAARLSCHTDDFRFDSTTIRALTGLERLSIFDPDTDECLSHAGQRPHFVESRRPEVSILICAKDKVGYTFNCLQSIKASCRDYEGRYEVRLVSDGSSQQTNRFLSGIHGLKLLTLRGNMGYVKSNNLGARDARGDYLVLLNNDTIVSKDFLSYLMRTFEEHHDVGVVGSKLLYPSGKLQEAGGIVWSNGTAWNFGKFDDANKSEYQYVRDVDYCSAAALGLRRRVVRRSGLFDERFHPGYYEDTDLCFFARSRGARVLYQPRAVAIHFEGASHGRTLSTGIKRYQLINRSKFAAKWKTALRLQYQQGPPNVLRASDRLGRKSILLIDLHVPQFDTNSGDLRTYWIMRLLRSLHWHVTLFPAVRACLEPYASTLEQHGIEVANDLLPEDLLRKRESYFNVIMLSKQRVALRCIDTVCTLSPRSVLVVDFPDLESVREERYARLINDNKRLLNAYELFQKEIELSKRADLVLTITDVERNRLLEADLQVPVEVIPNIHEIANTGLPFHKRRNILFVGAFRHPPNVDAVRFLVNQIFPLIRQRLGSAQLIIAGSDMPQLIRSMSAPRVRTLGYVEDLGPLLNSCRVFVAPLRYGAGLKGKIGMAMAAGLPIVTTAVGAEGIDSTKRRLLLVAENPTEFADQVTRLYTDERLWDAISNRLRLYANANYSPTVVRRRLREAFGKARPLNLQKRLTLAPRRGHYQSALAWFERSLMRKTRDAPDDYAPTVLLRSVQIVSTYGWHHFISRALQKARMKDFRVS